MKSSLKLISDDASDRKFYREVSLDGENPIVRMHFSTWSGGYGGDPSNWLEMQCALTEMQIPVPKVYKINQAEGIIWTEDLGDNFLSSKLTTDMLDISNPACNEAIRYYQDALKLIVQAQYSTTRMKHPALNKFFDFEKLYYEMTFFVDHFLNGFLDLGISEETNPDLYVDLKNLSKKLDVYERVFCHRDYHVRNIMLKDEKIYWIDFQDARMGPHTYDVVSLVRDSYVDITWPTRKFLYDFYHSNLNQKRKECDLLPISEDDFYIETLFMGLQRNIKAIGSFAYLATKKQKTKYLQHIFHTLNIICSGEALVYTKTNLNLIAEFPHLFNLLLNLQSGDMTHKLEKKINATKQT